MFKLSEIFVEVTARTGQLGPQLGVVKAQVLGLVGAARVLGPTVAGAIDMMTGAMAANPIGAIVMAVVALTVGLTKTVRAASDLNETVQKTEQVFGSATSTVVKGADEMAKKYGVVKREFLDAASMFGGALQGAGMEQAKAAELAVTLTKRAADVASQYNMDNQVAMERMMAALRGEYDPAEHLGVFMNEAAVKAKAYAMGLAKAGQELTLQAKMMARVQLLMEQTKRAEGDLERTGGGFANQWRKFAGNLENIAVKIGDEVMPAFTTFLVRLNQGLEWAIEHFKQLKDAIMNAVPALRLLAWAFSSPESDEERKMRERRKEIDERNEEMRKATLTDEAKATDMKDRKAPKGWMGGIEEFAKHLQESAWNKNDKDKLGKDALAEAKLHTALLKKILDKPPPPITT